MNHPKLKVISYLTSLFVLFNLATSQIQAQTRFDPADPYQTKLYWKLNDSPMQQKLRSLRPFPVGVVYYQQLDHQFPEIVSEFKKIHNSGFPALKQIMLRGPLQDDNDYKEKVFKAALDEGLSPWYYGMGGWDPITPELCKKLGISQAPTPENMPSIEKDPRMLKYQTDMLKKRVENMKNIPPLPKSISFGEPGRGNPFITERLVPLFADWLRKTYPTIEDLRKAWGQGFTLSEKLLTYEDAAKMSKGTGIDEFGRGTGLLGWDVRRFRDCMRFQADLAVGDYERAMQHYIKYEPNEPKRTGGHQLFENQAYNGWDLEGQAKSAAIGGSFYSSIHLAHHFFLTNNELSKPVYLQARIIADAFKGGWAATWESTGGPTQWSGYEGFNVDGKLITRLMLSYVAAGLKGIGFWMWNSRDTGWEVGEYALTDIQGEPGSRAKAAAEITKALDKQRFELWEAMDEPTVGVLYSWDNEAILGRFSVGSYPLATRVYKTERNPEFAQYYSQSRIGLSRALINNNVPFEYLSENDLKAGLGGRYKIIYLPYMFALSKPVVKMLADYVKAGGRLVADMPLMMVDEGGVLNKYLKGEDFEQMFGFQIADYQNTFNAPHKINGIAVNGQFTEVKTTAAQTTARFDQGEPAILENKYGKGSTLVFNFEASHNCFKPGNTAMENLLVEKTLGNIKPPFKTNKTATVYRRSAPKADHYFLLNEAASATDVTFAPDGFAYTDAEDCISGEKITLNNSEARVTVPAGSGRWIRCRKK